MTPYRIFRRLTARRTDYPASTRERVAELIVAQPLGALEWWLGLYCAVLGLWLLMPWDAWAVTPSWWLLSRVTSESLIGVLLAVPGVAQAWFAYWPGARLFPLVRLGLAAMLVAVLTATWSLNMMQEARSSASFTWPWIIAGELWIAARVGRRRHTGSVRERYADGEFVDADPPPEEGS